MTGNKDADEDIMAFFKAKEEMMKNSNGEEEPMEVVVGWLRFSK